MEKREGRAVAIHNEIGGHVYEEWRGLTVISDIQFSPGSMAERIVFIKNLLRVRTSTLV